jgi:DNA-binding response OmpR family regulator
MTQLVALIIEDDLELGLIAAEILQFIHFDTEIIQDGAMAFDRIMDKIPDLVLLDLHLPGKSGLDILSDIRATERLTQTKVIIVSADALHLETLKDKADLVLLKPYNVDQLYDFASQIRMDRM